MSQKCKGLKTDGSPCIKWALESGYCNTHDPASVAKAEIARLKQEDLSYLQLKDRQLKQRQNELDRLRLELECEKSEQVTNIVASIKTIDDPESLRQAELEIIVGLVEEKIDPKAGGPIASLLKHQAELLGVTKRQTEGKKDPLKRKVMIAMSAELTNEEVFMLVGNVGEGIKRLEQKADAMDEDEILTIMAQEPVPVEMDVNPEISSEDAF
ncbi:MAG TPA: hypothetical protein EYN91_04245 [Candidatus Melainabacteria bacterium]|nr:hypothetical protein [Candidatus Melainabacteria bacterium]HIN66154.1 hypothetical protein [Candidatus Obscuribacterales bacterium]